MIALGRCVDTRHRDYEIGYGENRIVGFCAASESDVEGSEICRAGLCQDGKLRRLSLCVATNWGVEPEIAGQVLNRLPQAQGVDCDCAAVTKNCEFRAFQTFKRTSSDVS